MKPGFSNALLAELGRRLEPLHLFAGPITPESVAVACGLAAVCVALGLLLSTRLLAQSDLGAVWLLTASVFAVPLGIEAIRYQLQPTRTATDALLAILAVALVVALAQRVLDTRVPRAMLTLAVGGFFAGLTGVLLAEVMRIGNAF